MNNQEGMKNTSIWDTLYPQTDIECVFLEEISPSTQTYAKAHLLDNVNVNDADKDQMEKETTAHEDISVQLGATWRAARTSSNIWIT